MNHAVIFLASAVPEGRVFGLDSQTLIQVGLHLLNGAILAIALTFILYKPVKDFMQRRSEKIRGEMEEAAAAMAKANALIAEYETRMARIQQERSEILEAARQQAEEEGRAILEDAQEEAGEVKKRALESIAEDKKRLWEEVRLQAIDLSCLIAERYVTVSMDDQAQKQYFDQVLAQLEETQWRS